MTLWGSDGFSRPEEEDRDFGPVGDRGTPNLRGELS